MSVQTEIDRINSNIAATYSALSAKGATMPTTQNSDNLAATVGTLSSIVDETTLEAIAESIRDRTGIAGDIEPEQMKIDIASLRPTNYSFSSYVETEALRVAALAEAAMNDNTIAFIALSDTHVLSTNTTTMAGLNSAVNGARIIKETIPVDFSVVLGDVSFGAGDDTRELHQANLLASRRAMGVLSPDVVLEGNHDRGYNADAYLTGDLLYRYVGRFNNNVTRPSTNADRGYCYMDLTDKKTRVIFMNTSDLRDKDDTFHGDCYISADQYSWLVSTLTEVGANTGWNILLLTHHPLHWAENMGNLATLLTAYVNGTSGSVTVDSTTVSYSFSGKNKATLLCNIHGHTHNFITGRVGTAEIVRIGTPNAYFYRNNEYTGDYGESTTYNKTANSAKDTAFCVYVVDTSALTVKAFCYGAGYDRTVSIAPLATYTITNTLTSTTNSNSATSITEGAAYSATLSPASGYQLGTVKVTMGGTDVTSSVYSNGTITISSVTGNIVITATSTVIPPSSYTVTYALTYTTSSNTAATVTANAAYSATLTANSGYELDSVKVTMGGTDITSSAYSNGKVTISSVTGNIVITAVSVKAITYVNLVPTSLASGGGSVYNTTGYKDGYRLNSSGTETALSDAACTGFIPYNDEVIRFVGSRTTNMNGTGWYIAFYDSSFTHTYSLACSNTSFVKTLAEHPTIKASNGGTAYMLTVDPAAQTTATIKNYFLNAAYIRISAPNCTGSDMIVTLNQAIE